MAYYADISRYRPVKDWRLVKRNCPFLISKATEGTDYTDPTLDDFIRGCENNEIPYWLYAYLRNGNEPAQAAFLTEVCKARAGKYFVGYALDAEEGNAAADVKRAMDYLAGSGKKCMLYTGYADYSRYQEIIRSRPSGCAWWESRYGLNNGTYNSGYPCHSGVDLHQYTSIGHCPGITPQCDLNRLTGSRTEAWFCTGEQTAEDPDGTVLDHAGVFQERKDRKGEVSYQGHLRGIGWVNWQCDGAMAGSTGQSRRVEALRISPVKHMDVTVHIRDIGDKLYKNITESTIIGTTGQEKRLEALKIESGDTVYLYRVHQKNLGWSRWCVNGQWAGEKGKSLQIEAVEIQVADIAYLAHVQGSGDTVWMADGMTAGTTGSALRLEALRIKSQHCGNIEAQAHIQDEGWIDYGTVNQNILIGTAGEKKRLECLRLKGNFEWRAHIQGTGWTQWTRADGVSTLGTVGRSLRMEAVEMRKI